MPDLNDACQLCGSRRSVQGRPLSDVVNTTKSKLDDSHGPVAFETPWAVVRIMEKDNELLIYVHNKNAEGVEETPRGYMVGSNLLIKEKKHA
jgi:hypothetical protein